VGCDLVPAPRDEEVHQHQDLEAEERLLHLLGRVHRDHRDVVRGRHGRHGELEGPHHLSPLQLQDHRVDDVVDQSALGQDEQVGEGEQHPLPHPAHDGDGLGRLRGVLLQVLHLGHVRDVVLHELPLHRHRQAADLGAERPGDAHHQLLDLLRQVHRHQEVHEGAHQEARGVLGRVRVVGDEEVEALDHVPHFLDVVLQVDLVQHLVLDAHHVLREEGAQAGEELFDQGQGHPQEDLLRQDLALSPDLVLSEQREDGQQHLLLLEVAPEGALDILLVEEDEDQVADDVRLLELVADLVLGQVVQAGRQQGRLVGGALYHLLGHHLQQRLVVVEVGGHGLGRDLVPHQHVGVLGPLELLVPGQHERHQALHRAGDVPGEELGPEVRLVHAPHLDPAHLGLHELHHDLPGLRQQRALVLPQRVPGRDHLQHEVQLHLLLPGQVGHEEELPLLRELLLRHLVPLGEQPPAPVDQQQGEGAVDRGPPGHVYQLVEQVLHVGEEGGRSAAVDQRKCNTLS